MLSAGTGTQEFSYGGLTTNGSFADIDTEIFCLPQRRAHSCLGLMGLETRCIQDDEKVLHPTQTITGAVVRNYSQVGSASSSVIVL